MYHCRRCLEDVGSREEMATHLQTIHDRRPVFCPECPGWYAESRDSLQRHQRESHAKMVTCQVEGCHFRVKVTQAARLMQHFMAVHTPGRQSQPRSPSPKRRRKSPTLPVSSSTPAETVRRHVQVKPQGFPTPGPGGDGWVPEILDSLDQYVGRSAALFPQSPRRIVIRSPARPALTGSSLPVSIPRGLLTRESSLPEPQDLRTQLARKTSPEPGAVPLPSRALSPVTAMFSPLQSPEKSVPGPSSAPSPATSLVPSPMPSPEKSAPGPSSAPSPATSLAPSPMPTPKKSAPHALGPSSAPSTSSVPSPMPSLEKSAPHVILSMPYLSDAPERSAPTVARMPAFEGDALPFQPGEEASDPRVPSRSDVYQTTARAPVSPWWYHPQPTDATGTTLNEMPCKMGTGSSSRLVYTPMLPPPRR